MSGEKGEGTSQERQKEKRTKTVILESISFFPAVDTTAQKDLPSLLLIFPPSLWLVGFP